MKQLLITIDDSQDVSIEVVSGVFTTFEFFGIAETLRLSAEEEERLRIRQLLEAKQDEMGKEVGRSHSGSNH